MFYRKRIKQLEDRVDALEVQVKEIYAITSKYCQDVDQLLLAYKRQEEAKERAMQEANKPAPRPRRRPRKNNGKENKFTE
jgi:hypothetical protein